MWRIAWTALVLVVALLGAAPAAQAQKRVALVIGNGAYMKVPALSNPTNDAAVVEMLFRSAGFEDVRRADNLKLADLRKTVRDFSAQATGADIAVVFFAGHGIEVNGTNYLIPIDAVLEHDVDVRDEAFPLDRVSEALEQAKRLRLIVLDACRDNPFVRSMKRTLVGRSIGRGLAPVEVLGLDTLIAYAAKAGYTASDGAGQNSPYTLALQNHLTTPGLDVRLALGRVRDEVLKATNSRQEPWVYGSLGGTEVVLVAAKTAVPSPLGQAAAEWGTLRTKTDIAELEAFAKRHARTYFAEYAKSRIEELKKVQVAVAKAEPEQKAKRTEPVEKKTELIVSSQFNLEAAEAWGKTRDTSDLAVLEAFIARYKETAFAQVAQARAEMVLKQQQAVAPRKQDKASKPYTERLGSVDGTTQSSKRAEPEPYRKFQRIPAGFAPVGVEPLTLADERALVPKDHFVECARCPQMVVLPAGEFTMGSPEWEEDRSSDEGPQRRVTIAKPFAVGIFEVTFAEWEACVANGGCTNNRDPDDEGWGRDQRPVINVSWDDATQYVAWLSKTTGKTYRLLTEAEWEYAARGVTKASAPHAPFATGATISTDQANYDGAATYGNGKKGVHRQKTVEVGSFPTNAFGLHDMHGNVQEWVQARAMNGSTWCCAPSDSSQTSSRSGSNSTLSPGSHPWWRQISTSSNSDHAVRASPISSASSRPIRR